jgi:hypothetical protein
MTEIPKISYFCEITSRRDICVLWTSTDHPLLHWSLDEAFAFLSDLEDAWHIRHCGRFSVGSHPWPETFYQFTFDMKSPDSLSYN